ncbi:MAG: 1,4-dihydroxy-6-naphthoate synthase [Saprospiraceae bacterium]|nr:1,4-dihydroxy-6-naphthoate synthase [Saprospiraceae bacterium]
MQLAIGFSPCPNDTFIFHAMLSGLVEGPKVQWQPHLEDVESLNEHALLGLYPVTKLSYHAYAYASGKYQLLDSGSALGFGCGPLLISKQNMELTDFVHSKVAIPGKLTTAHFLLNLAFPNITDKVFMPFYQIEEAILSGTVDAGVIIHENRFTYAAKGLKLIEDLGAFWEKSTGSPIPLGGIAVRRDLPMKLKLEINTSLAASVRYAHQNPDRSAAYVALHAQEMDPDVRNQHITLYVNHFSENLGIDGRMAIASMYREAVAKGIIAYEPEDMFLNDIIF